MAVSSSIQSCVPDHVDLCIYQGNTKVVVIAFTDEAGQPVDTTDWVVESQIRDRYADDAPELALFDVTWGSGGQAHVATMRLEAWQTAALPFTKGRLRWDVDVSHAGTVVTPVAGDVIVEGETTRTGEVVAP